jgi:plastocyanin
MHSALAGGLHVEVRASDGKPVADTVVVAVPLDAGANVSPQTQSSGQKVVDQIDKQFVPYVKPVLAGSKVYFPNKDNIRHQVYSFSPAKRFELPLYAGTPADPVIFDKPGVVTLGCNIHDWMIGYIYVSESPWFAITVEDGNADIINLPAGHYHVRIWHPAMAQKEEQTARNVEIGDGNITQKWMLPLSSSARPRRAPVPGATGYH